MRAQLLSISIIWRLNIPEEAGWQVPGGAPGAGGGAARGQQDERGEPRHRVRAHHAAPRGGQGSRGQPCGDHGSGTTLFTALKHDF